MSTPKTPKTPRSARSNASSSSSKGGGKGDVEGGEEEPMCGPRAVYVLNTGELFQYPLSMGAATKAHHLVTSIAHKMSVPVSAVTISMYNTKISHDTRLCTLPEKICIHVQLDSDIWSTVMHKSTGNNANSTSQLNTSRATADKNVTNIDSLGAPTKVSDVRSLRLFDLNEKYVGVQANVELDSSPDRTRAAGGGGGSGLNKSKQQKQVGQVDPSDPTSTVYLPEPENDGIYLISVKVCTEGCNSTVVTVESNSDIADLRIRCNVSPDTYPTVSCNGRRVLLEQLSLKEQAIGDDAKIVFHRKHAYEWEDGSAGRRPGDESYLASSRIVRSSGGKNIALGDPSTRRPEEIQASPNRSAAASTSEWASSVPHTRESNIDKRTRQQMSVARLHQLVQNASKGIASPPPPSPIAQSPIRRFGSHSNNNNNNSNLLLDQSSNNNNNHYSPNANSAAAAAAGGGGGGSGHHFEPSIALNNSSSSMNSSYSNSNYYPQPSPTRNSSSSMMMDTSALRQQQQQQNHIDAPSSKQWISPTWRKKDFDSPEFQEAAYGKTLKIRFEDPTDDFYTHEIKVWSKNAVSSLFEFAGGDEAFERYHLLCDGQLILYHHYTFGMVTKGEDGCLFSFAVKG